MLNKHSIGLELDALDDQHQRELQINYDKFSLVKRKHHKRDKNNRDPFD